MKLKAIVILILLNILALPGVVFAQAKKPNILVIFARAHAKSGDATMISGYLGSNSSFDEAIASFAVGYAEQNERDYDALRKAVGDGRVAATEEPV